MISVFFLLGSNLGDRHLLLKQAIEAIGKAIGPVIRASSIYETQSWGKTDAPDYLNQVILAQTNLSARSILEEVLAIESSLGRHRAEKWGSRTIDIDILFYGEAVIEEPGLSIPHPELHKRRFTLEPLAEIAPEMLHPLLNKRIFEIKNELKDDLIVKKLYF